LAKVGGLVGKVIDIDEGSKYRYDYVRLLIACRDVARVPRKAEGTLGLEIIDFGFARELPEESGHKVLKSGIIVSDDQQPRMKKSKTDTSIMPPEANSGPTLSVSKDVVGDSGKAVQEAYWSAPPKINFKPRSQTKLLADAQKAYKNYVNEEEEGMVHIPKTFEDSDSKSDSDSFTIKVQRLTGMPVNQYAHDDKGQSSTQTWFMENISSNIDGAPSSVGLQKSILDMTLSDGGKDTKTCQVTAEILVEGTKEDDTMQKMEKQATRSPEIFITDDNIINTQESCEIGVDENAEITGIVDPQQNVYITGIGMDDAVYKSLNEATVAALQDIDGNIKVDGLVLESHKTKPSVDVEVEKCNDKPDAGIPVIQGGRSDSLKKDTTLNTMEKGEMMAKKRNLEGNIATPKTFSALPVDELVH
jgi:hypothetical protein